MADLVCSAKACREAATRALLWRNPRLHTPERQKVWLACDAHEESLGAFLGVRGFLLERVPVEEIPASAG